MITQHSRTALLAGLLTAALAVPVLAADVDSVKAQATPQDQPLVVAASTTAAPGPVLDRQSLGPAMAAAGQGEVALEGSSEPTRSAANLEALRKARAARAARVVRASAYNGNGNGYRTPIILGVRF